GFLRAESPPEWQHTVGIVHAVGDDRRVRLAGAELFPHGGMLARKLGVQHDAERNIQLFEQAPDPRDAPVDRVLAKRLIHEVGTARREVRTQHRPLAEAELFDEQGKTAGNLPAAWPGGNMDRSARERGHPVGALLPEYRGGIVKSEQRRCCPAEQGDERALLHCPSNAPDSEMPTLAHARYGQAMLCRR